MHEKEQKKDTVTYTEIGQKLKKDALLNIPALVILYPLVFGMVALSYLVGHIFYDIMATVFMVMLFASLVSVVAEIIITVSDVNHKRYSVFEDKYLNETEERKPVQGRCFIYHFESGKEYTVSADELVSAAKQHYQTLLDYMRLSYSAGFSHEGDPFYVVTFDRNPQKIVLMFSQAIFNYKDE